MDEKTKKRIQDLKRSKIKISQLPLTEQTKLALELETVFIANAHVHASYAQLIKDLQALLKSGNGIHQATLERITKELTGYLQSYIDKVEVEHESK